MSRTPSAPASLAAAGEGFEADLHDGVEIAEEDDAGCGASCADVFADFENVGEACAAGHRSFASPLDHGAVGEWITEGHAEFDDVCAVVDGGDGHVARGGEIGISGGDVDDEAGFFLEANWHYWVALLSANALHKEPTM